MRRYSTEYRTFLKTDARELKTTGKGCAGLYRYGFNGMEKDDDWYGAGNEYTTEFRQLDVRTGRWMSMDPMMAVVPDRSPYEFVFNNPIAFVDPSGLLPSGKGGGNPNKNQKGPGQHKQAKDPPKGNGSGDAKGSGEGLLSSIGSTIKGMGSGILRYTENKVDWMQRFKTPEGRAYNVNSMKESIQGTYDAVVNPTVPHLPNALGSAVIQFGRKFGEMSAFEQGELIGEVAFGSIDGWAYGKVLQGSIQFVRIGLSPAQKLFIRRSGVSNLKTLDPKEIHFMQSSIKNTTGGFTVVGNAEALKLGTLNPDVLKINVWKDLNGKIWTLDHRRLAAFRLSGLKSVPVEWADPTDHMWKMTTKNGGASIKLKIEPGKSVIVE